MKTTFVVLALIVLCSVSIAFGQQDSTWVKWNWLIGEWIGEGSGVPGQGGGQFSLLPDLDRKILVRKNHAEYPATKDKPAVIHDDLMIAYTSSPGKPEKAIYFDNEGHTIQYTVATTNKSIVFTSDKVQSAPVFRLTYELLDGGMINVKFEMSRDGEKFMTYTEGKCRKKK